MYNNSWLVQNRYTFIVAGILPWRPSFAKVTVQSGIERVYHTHFMWKRKRSNDRKKSQRSLTKKNMDGNSGGRT